MRGINTAMPSLFSFFAWVGIALLIAVVPLPGSLAFFKMAAGLIAFGAATYSVTAEGTRR